MQNDQYAQQVKQGHARMVDRFVRLITPKRRSKHTTENAEFFAMLQRMIRAAEARVCDDPSALPMVRELVERLGEVIPVAIATSSARYDVNPYAAASAGECGRALNITKQSASERARKGREIIAKRLAAGNGIQFSEARREREARDRAEQVAAVAFVDFRERRRTA